MSKGKGRKVNATGRSDGAPPFVQFPCPLIETPAFHFLSTDGRSALFYMAKRYYGWNNGKIGFGVRSGGFVRNGGAPELIDMPIMSKTRMQAALVEIEAFKLATVVKASSFVQKKLTREWRLNWLPCDGKPPTNEFQALRVADCERIRAALKTKASG